MSSKAFSPVGGGEGSAAGFVLVSPVAITSFEDRVRRLVDEVMLDLGRDVSEIADVVEPPGADYCVITFRDETMKPIEISRPMGAGETQEQDEVRRALQYRFHT